MGEQIADALRRDILFGQIRPGTRLSQQQLCERFGTSRMPVRDGMRMLVHQGLLMVDQGQHAVVAPLSRSDLLDAFLIEGVLAGMAAGRASKHAKPEDLEYLRAVHDKMVCSSAEGRSADMANHNWTFHRYINRMSRSRKLLSALKSLSLDVPRDFLAEMPEWSNRSNEEHESILGAFEAREHDTVEQLMRQHIAASGEGLISFLESRGLDLD